jgi:hypothetical protein
VAVGTRCPSHGCSCQPLTCLSKILASMKSIVSRWMAASALALALPLASGVEAFGTNCAAGYYRFPALHHQLLVFTAEGDLSEGSQKGPTILQ